MSHVNIIADNIREGDVIVNVSGFPIDPVVISRAELTGPSHVQVWFERNGEQASSTLAIGTVVVVKRTTTLTISVELLDEPHDGRDPMTWKDIRLILNNNLPASNDLRVEQGLSDPIDYNTVWGRLRINVEQV